MTLISSIPPSSNALQEQKLLQQSLQDAQKAAKENNNPVVSSTVVPVVVSSVSPDVSKSVSVVSSKLDSSTSTALLGAQEKQALVSVAQSNTDNSDVSQSDDSGQNSTAQTPPRSEYVPPKSSSDVSSNANGNIPVINDSSNDSATENTATILQASTKGLQPAIQQQPKSTSSFYV